VGVIRKNCWMPIPTLNSPLKGGGNFFIKKTCYNNLSQPHYPILQGCILHKRHNMLNLKIVDRCQTLKKKQIAVYIFSLIYLFAGVNAALAAFWNSNPKATRIALLLPLQGPFAESAQAIQEGFIAAYYQNLTQDQNPPTIRIVDSSRGDILEIYRQAVSQGANVIVGPLNKEAGLQLVQAQAINTPTILLNNLSNASVSAGENLYQLALSPEDEATAAADKAWQDGRRKALVVAPANAWGQRVSQAFLNRWQSLGGKIVGELFFDDPKQLASQIAQILHVDLSEQRSKDLRRTLSVSKLRSIPYRRQDIDMVFLTAKPEIAREIRPLLGFYYAGKIPVYATSHIYGGYPNPQYDQDLNGVNFCAIPWEITPQKMSVDLQAILNNVQKAWPQASQEQAAFFALGADSYYLARQLLQGNPPQTWEGATGKLILQSNKIWYRQLPWTKMIQGQPENAS
jgi:outer membrane PBP1 activator LpoA protein